jgi:UDP-perosamine 4-acetyltransferase
MNVVVLGAGGHAKVVIETLRACGLDVAGVVSPDADGPVLGAPLLGRDEDLPAIFKGGVSGAFIAIGANRLRCKLGAMARQIGFALPNAIHPAAALSPSAKFGEGVAVMAGAVINAEARIGDFAIVNTNASVDHECVLGEGAHVACGATLAGNVTLGARVLVGASAAIAPDLTICDDAVLGAGACAVRSINTAGTYVGVPARVRS